MKVSLPELSPSLHASLGKCPTLLRVLAAAWLLARGLRDLFWTLFGLYWAFHALCLAGFFR